MPLFLQSISCPAWLFTVSLWSYNHFLHCLAKKKKSYSLYLNMRMFKILRLKNYCSDIFLACYTFGNTVINTKWYFIFIFKQIMNYKQNTQVVSSIRSPLRDIVVGKIWGAWEEKICFKCFAFSQETLRSLAKPVEFGQTLPVYFTACSGYSSNVHNGAVHRVLF